MEQTKTKKALIMSVLSMVLCIAMLIGMTFAWFTDTASTGVNKIQAGTLKVDIVDNNGASLEGKTLYFRDVNENKNVLWEPGATFNLDSFKIVNKGKLALKYKVAITGLTGDAELLEAIDFTIKDENGNEQTLNGWEGKLLPNGAAAIDNMPAGETGCFTITGKMKESAGNEYQGKSLEGIGITVYATQLNYESDSFNNTYDESADYDKGDFFYADSVDSLKAAAAKVQPGDVIKLTDDITLDKTINFTTNNIIFDGQKHTITANIDNSGYATAIKFGEEGKWCQNITVKDLTLNGKGGIGLHFHGGNSSTLDNVKIGGDWHIAINFYGTHGAVMNNCDISSSYTDKYCKSSIFANQQSANQIILNNTTIDSMFVNATDEGKDYANGGIKVVVNSGSHIGKLHANSETRRTFHTINGGTVGEVLYDIE